MKEILEDNIYWTLYRTISEENEELILLSKNDDSGETFTLSFHISGRGLVKKQTSDHSEYSWESRKGDKFLFYENGLAIKFHNNKLIVNHKDCSILFAENDKGIYDFCPSVYKIKSYNNCLEITDFSLGIFNKNSVEFRSLCCLNNDSYYHICYFDNFLRVICHDDSCVKIFSFDKDGNEGQKAILLYNVDEMYRLTQKVGNVTYMYSFFILKSGDSCFIMNLKTLKYIEKSFNMILPTSFSVEVKDYLVKQERFVVKQNPEYLCVDNIIYDEEMNIVSSLESKWDKKPVLLDVYDCYIAISDFRDRLHIFTWKIWNLPNEEIIEDSHYFCRFNNDNNKIEIIVADEHHSNSLAPFDPIRKKFVADIETISDIYGKKKNTDYEEANEYSIMDALDGEPDAYWNID